MFLTGPVPRYTAFEDVGGAFCRDPEGAVADPIADDQALYIDTPRGIVVVLGCAHAGVINTVNYVRALTGGKPLHMVVGGMHLANASRERVAATVAALGHARIDRLLPAHCTGPDATAALRAAFPGACEWVMTGMQIRV